MQPKQNDHIEAVIEKVEELKKVAGVVEDEREEIEEILNVLYSFLSEILARFEEAVPGLER